jgi:hypothetical protein
MGSMECYVCMYVCMYVFVFLVVGFLPACLLITHIRSYSHHSCYMSCPSHPPLLYDFDNTWLRTQVLKLLVMQFSPPFCHFKPTRSIYSPQHHVLKDPSLCFSPDVRDHVAHPCGNTGKIIVFHVVIFVVLNLNVTKKSIGIITNTTIIAQQKSIHF